MPTPLQSDGKGIEVLPLNGVEYGFFCQIDADGAHVLLHWTHQGHHPE
jgi:hypothetical protein